MSTTLQTVPQPTEATTAYPLDEAKYEDFSRQECPFARDDKLWSPAKLSNDYDDMAARSVGRYYAVWLISHLQQYAGIGIADLLPDTVQAMFGRKLSPLEYEFFYGLAEFIQGGQVWIEGNFTAKAAATA